MPNYKLIYFSIEGIAVSRFLFAVAGQDHEDIRVELEEWPSLKPETPLGQLPVLEVDGWRIPQTMAIVRYLARKFGLYGDTEEQKTQIDVIVEVTNDLHDLTKKFFYEKDKERKAISEKEMIEVHAPKILKQLETLLVSNGGGDGYFVGSKISLADICAFTWVYDRLPHYKIENKEPKLKSFVERIRALPSVDSWLKRRPDTDKLIV